jgi:hypothetical protein
LISREKNGEDFAISEGDQKLVESSPELEHRFKQDAANQSVTTSKSQTGCEKIRDDQQQKLMTSIVRKS